VQYGPFRVPERAPFEGGVEGRCLHPSLKRQGEKEGAYSVFGSDVVLSDHYSDPNSIKGCRTILSDKYIDYTEIFGRAYRFYRYFYIGISILYRYFKTGISSISVFPDPHIDYTDTTDTTDTDTDTDIIDMRYPPLKYNN
jgi:hypothetical protein